MERKKRKRSEKEAKKKRKNKVAEKALLCGQSRI
jgi:hypothetical protein